MPGYLGDRFLRQHARHAVWVVERRSHSAPIFGGLSLAPSPPGRSPRCWCAHGSHIGFILAMPNDRSAQILASAKARHPHSVAVALRSVSSDGHLAFLYALLGPVVRQRRSAYIGLLFAIGVMVARIFVIGRLRMAELAGATVALAIWLMLLHIPERLQMGTAGMVLCAYVIARLTRPVHLPGSQPHLPGVLSLASCKVRLSSVLSFLEKFFLYGTTLYLLTSSFRRRLPVTISVATLLFATSWAETWLPDRSAEVTDGLMVLIIALIFALMRPEFDPRRSAEEPRPQDLTDHGSCPVPLPRGDAAPLMGWRERAAARRAIRRNAIGEIEHY